MSTPNTSKSWELLCIPSQDLDLGDKAILPPSMLDELLASFDQKNSSPITLCISLTENKEFKIHVGVREFSSEEGHIILPNWLFKDLARLYTGEEASLKVTVRKTELPKGSWAKLIHQEGDMNFVKNIRAMFEASLRSNFTALTQGQLIRSTYGGKVFIFKVEELKPEDAVGIIDTDLEIDIVVPTLVSDGPDPSRACSERKTKIIQPGNKFNSNIVEGATYVVEFSWLVDVPFYVELISDKATGPNLYLLPESSDVSVEKHIWAAYGSSRKKRIDVDTKDPQCNLGQYFLAVEARTDCKYSLFIGPRESKVPDVIDSSKVICNNCLKAISKENHQMHEIFCSRNNTLCQLCRKVFFKKDFSDHRHCHVCSMVANIEEEASHFGFYHEEIICSCGTSCEGKHGLSRHKIVDCFDRLMECRFCHILVAHGPMSQKPEDILLGLTTHESYCGDKTITCTKCSAHVSLKKIPVHAKYHEYLRQRQPPPFKKCSNFGCSRPQPNDTNVLSLCQNCFSSFWSPNHDPGHKTLTSRVASRYHSQLTTGCQNSWCINPHCATSTGNAMDPTSAALSLITFLKVPLPTDKQCFFCVDFSSAQKWIMLQQLLAEMNNRYLAEWCIKALELSDHNVKQAAKWLTSNAPVQNSA